MTLPLQKLEEEARNLGRWLKARMPPGTGFVVVLFDFNAADKGNMTYLSSGVREDIVKMLRELATKIEASPPPAPQRWERP